MLKYLLSDKKKIKKRVNSQFKDLKILGESLHISKNATKATAGQISKYNPLIIYLFQFVSCMLLNVKGQKETEQLLVIF